MRPNYSNNIYSSGRIRPVNLPTEDHNNTYSYASNLHKSPIHKSGSLNYPYNQQNVGKPNQSGRDNSGHNHEAPIDADDRPRKISGSIKNLEEKIENVEHLMKNNKNNGASSFKKDFPKMG